MKDPKRKLYVEEFKKKKRKRNHHARFLSNTPRNIKSLQQGKRRGSVYFKHHKLSYRLPLIITIAMLLVFILAIPALIVLPFSEQAEEDLARETDPIIENDEAISVAVMRTKSDVVEDVPLENYIVGVVAAEMPVEFEEEALKAQALAARTYAISHLLGDNKDKESYDLTDTIQHQVYKSDRELQSQWGSAYEENMNKIRSAVEATAGEIITYEEQPIMPAYFSMSNGFTENAEDYWENALPYLRSVESHWDLENPNLISQETFSRSELASLLAVDIPQAIETFQIERKDSGRVARLTLGEEVFTGREVREKLSLRSSDFSIKQKNDHYVFTTKGNGHGIGMSQYGADAMAKNGKTYDEIINHYYEGIEIHPIKETAPTLVSK